MPAAPADPKDRPKAEDRAADYGGYDGFKVFMGETTMHGVQHIFLGTFLVRMLWLAGVLIAIGGFLYFCITAVGDFLAFRSTTRIDIVHVRQLPTPAVTICNSNFAMLSSLLPPHQNASRNRNFVCGVYGLYNVSAFCPLTQSNLSASLLGDGRSIREVFLEIGQSRAELVPDVLAHDVSPGGGGVNSSQLTTVATHQGICHTFNDAGTAGGIRNTGMDVGVKFLVNVDQNQYAGVSLLSAGVEVYIHPPGEGILRGRNALYVGPGQRANIALSPQRRDILDSPYRKQGCVSSNINRDKSKPYSAKQCLLECQEDVTAAQCKCLAASVPTGATFTLSSGGTVTNTCSLTQYLNCSRVIAALAQSNSDLFSQCASRCRPPCTPTPVQYIYRTALSWDLFPSSFLAADFINSLVRTGGYNNPRNQTDLLYLRENFAQINVYYDELAYESIVERPAVTLASLFGSVGGNLGLFLGASMLTLLEFGQYLTRLLNGLLARRQTRSLCSSADGSNGRSADEVQLHKVRKIGLTCS